MDFYASLTINRCHLKRLCEMWHASNAAPGFPFQHVIVSPLFARNGILEKIFENREHCKVIFDSGGFHIQQGRMRLRSATRLLSVVYRENDWADRFALPDVPVTSFDSAANVRRKLNSTRHQYRAFPSRLAKSLRRKLLPVVHGTTIDELCRSAVAARRVGSGSLGFGGFSTSGPNSGVNSCTSHSLRILAQFVALCRTWKLDSHVFGIGGPAAIAVLQYAPVTTFDSAGWIRTAAYGNAYLPYVGAVNITGAAASRRYVTRREFNKLRKATAHICPFCRDENLLERSWAQRALHNYCTIRQTVDALSTAPPRVTLEKLRMYNPRFAGYLELMLTERARLELDVANRGTEGGH
jgi:hypothetical protein